MIVPITTNPLPFPPFLLVHTFLIFLAQLSFCGQKIIKEREISCFKITDISLRKSVELAGIEYIYKNIEILCFPTQAFHLFVSFNRNAVPRRDNLFVY